MAKKESKELAKAEAAKGVAPIEEFERRFEDFFRRPFPFFGPPWWPRLKTPEMEEIAPSVDMFRDGVLEIRVPRTEAARQKTKKVTIE